MFDSIFQSFWSAYFDVRKGLKHICISCSVDKIINNQLDQNLVKIILDFSFFVIYDDIVLAGFRFIIILTCIYLSLSRIRLKSSFWIHCTCKPDWYLKIHLHGNNSKSIGWVILILLFHYICSQANVYWHVNCTMNQNENTSGENVNIGHTRYYTRTNTIR